MFSSGWGGAVWLTSLHLGQGFLPVGRMVAVQKRSSFVGEKGIASFRIVGYIRVLVLRAGIAQGRPTTGIRAVVHVVGNVVRGKGKIN